MMNFLLDWGGYGALFWIGLTATLLAVYLSARPVFKEDSEIRRRFGWRCYLSHRRVRVPDSVVLDTALVHDVVAEVLRTYATLSPASVRLEDPRITQNDPGVFNIWFNEYNAYRISVKNRNNGQKYLDIFPPFSWRRQSEFSFDVGFGCALGFTELVFLGLSALNLHHFFDPWCLSFLIREEFDQRWWAAPKPLGV